MSPVEPFRGRRLLVSLAIGCAFVLCAPQLAHAATVSITGPAAGTLTQRAIGSAVTINFTTSCGTDAGVWATSAGALPAGLTLSGTTGANGSLSGTIGATAKVLNYNFTIRFTDSNTGAGTCTGTAADTNAYVMPVYHAFAPASFGGSNTPSAVLGSGTDVYVAESAANAVYKVSSATTNPPSSLTPAAFSMPTLNWPNGLAVVGAKLYATNFYAAGSSALSRQGDASPIALTGCSNPAGVAGDQAATAVFVACAGSNKVFQIDPSTGAVVGTALTLPTPGSGLTPAPAGVVTLTSTSVAPANTRVVVGDAANDRLFVVGENGASGPQILGAAAGVAVPGCVPANMSPEAPAAGTRGFVLACPGNGTIAAIQVTTASALSNLGTQYVGNGAGPTDTTSRPYGVAYRSADNRLVVTLSGANTAKVYDSQNLPLGPPLSTFTTGPYPDQVTLFASQASGVAGQANVSLAYLANSGDGTVWVVDPPMKKRKHGHKKQTAAKKLAAKKLAAKKLAAKRKLAKKLAAKKRKAGVRVARAGIDARNVAELRARAYTNPLHPPLTVAARG